LGDDDEQVVVDEQSVEHVEHDDEQHAVEQRDSLVDPDIVFL
jgi:hypothetical protein